MDRDEYPIIKVDASWESEDLLTRLEPFAQGCFSGNVSEWPQLKPLLLEVYNRYRAALAVLLTMGVTYERCGGDIATGLQVLQSRLAKEYRERQHVEGVLQGRVKELEEVVQKYDRLAAGAVSGLVGIADTLEKLEGKDIFERAAIRTLAGLLRGEEQRDE